MSGLKEEELEFISVNNDDENDMVSAYVDPSQPERANNIIGNWLFNQSKVENIFHRLSSHLLFSYK